MDNIHGNGKCVFADGKVYEGQWANNLMHGVGKCNWQDGKSYEG